MPPAVTPCDLVEVHRGYRGLYFVTYRGNRRPTSITRKSGFGSSRNSRCVPAKIGHSTCRMKNETAMEVTDRKVLSLIVVFVCLFVQRL